MFNSERKENTNKEKFNNNEKKDNKENNVPKKFIPENINNKNELTEFLQSYLMRNKDIIITLSELIITME